MAVPKKRVSRTRKYLRNTHWKKDILQEVVRSFSAAVSLGQNPTRFNRGRFSKTRNRRNGFGQPFGFVFEILSEDEEAEAILKKLENKTKSKTGPVTPPEPQDSASQNQNPDTPQ
jgi:hypothetical protein